MERECLSSVARYGITLDASLITGIDPPRRGGIGAGRHQHGAQPRFVRHQPGAGLGRPEDRAVEARGRNRNAQRPGRSRAAAARWPRNLGELKKNGPRCAARLSAQRALETLQPRQTGDSGSQRRQAMNGFLHRFSDHFHRHVHRSCRLLRRLSRAFGLYTIVEEGRCHVYVLFGKVIAILRRAGPAFSVGQTGPARA